jgi:hypothetical protein
MLTQKLPLAPLKAASALISLSIITGCVSSVQSRLNWDKPNWSQWERNVGCQAGRTYRFFTTDKYGDKIHNVYIWRNLRSNAYALVFDDSFSWYPISGQRESRDLSKIVSILVSWATKQEPFSIYGDPCNREYGMTQDLNEVEWHLINRYLKDKGYIEFVPQKRFFRTLSGKSRKRGQTAKI